MLHLDKITSPQINSKDIDPDETQDWLDSVDSVISTHGEDRAKYLLSRLLEHPQLHDLVLSLQGRAVSHILHPTVMKRLVDSSQYGNTYLPDEVLSDLFDGIFVQREIPTTFKMGLQSKYVDSLIGALDENDYDEISKSAIYASLVDIRNFTKIPYGDSKTKVHYRFLNWKASKALED